MLQAQLLELFCPSLQSAAAGNNEGRVKNPLNNAASSGPSDEYIRPEGRYSVLLPKTTLSVLTKYINIWKEC